MDVVCSWVSCFRELSGKHVVVSGVADVLWALWKVRNKACLCP
jgi:hypothetical protein